MNSVRNKSDEQLLAALHVETTVRLTDPEALGLAVAGLSSDEQANFLAGLAVGFAGFDSTLHSGMQLAWIADDFKDSPSIGKRVADLLRDLADHIDEVLS